MLGSTGSIGRNTLRVVAEAPGEWEVVALAAGRNATLLAEQIRAWEPALAAVADAATVRAVRLRLADSPLPPGPAWLYNRLHPTYRS